MLSVVFLEVSGSVCSFWEMSANSTGQSNHKFVAVLANKRCFMERNSSSVHGPDSCAYALPEEAVKLQHLRKNKSFLLPEPYYHNLENSVILPKSDLNIPRLFP